MSVIQHLKTKISRGNQDYVCLFCNLSFEKPHKNCPACGCSDIE